MSIDFDKIWTVLVSHFRLRKGSHHGPDHWRRVEQNGLRIAEENGADELVVRLFAALHDVKRESDGYDPEHGVRAALFARELQGDLFQVSEFQLETLCTACQLHNDGHVSDQETIGACWDADRLDLPRVGIPPEPTFMSTEYGRRKAVEWQRR